MIKAPVMKAINEQIVKEYYSGWLYMQMAAWFEKENLKGIAHWLRVQSQEEACHGLIFFNYLCDCGGEVKLGAVAAPTTAFASAHAIFKTGLEHEFTVTASIAAIMDLAVQEKDYATQSLLKWFVDEQVEEEANFDAICSKLARVGNDGNGLLQLDRELGTRIFTLTPPLAGKLGAAP